MKALVIALLTVGSSVIAFADGVDRVIVRDYQGHAFVVSVDRLSYNQNGQMVISAGVTSYVTPQSQVADSRTATREPQVADLRPNIEGSGPTTKRPGPITKPIFLTSDLVVDSRTAVRVDDGTSVR